MIQSIADQFRIGSLHISPSQVREEFPDNPCQYSENLFQRIFELNLVDYGGNDQLSRNLSKSNKHLILITSYLLKQQNYSISKLVYALSQNADRNLKVSSVLDT